MRLGSQIVMGVTAVACGRRADELNRRTATILTAEAIY
jgi:hypothetical protein